MTGQSPKSPRDLSAPKVSTLKATLQPSKVPHRAELGPETHKAVENRDSTEIVFGPNFDRGRYPAQQPRYGGGSGHESRSSSSLAVGSTPLVLSPPAVEDTTYTSPTLKVGVSSSAENVLPSPSPSVEARPNSGNAVEANDKENQAHIAETGPVEAPNATFEELVTRCGGMEEFEKLLKDAGKSSYGPSQIAASAVTQELRSASPSSNLVRQGRPSGYKNQRRSESDRDAQAPLIASKRPQEITDEPRKRLQSLPGSSSNDLFALSSATTPLLSQNVQNVQNVQDVQNNPNVQNVQSCTAARSSGIEMQALAQQLDQRMRLVASLPERKGSQVERPRLVLLREACKNSDLFYLILHQLFCYEHQCRKSDQQVLNFDDVHRTGLETVAFLLVSNDDMVDDAVAWFSVFPLPWGNSFLNKSEFGTAHAKVQRCLANMATFWKDMRFRCSQRRYPPLVDEIVGLFGVESFLFQQIIFRAILRDLWSGNFDECFSTAERLFSKDFQAVMSRSSLDVPVVELVKSYQRAVIKEYQQIFEIHRQHTIGGTTVNVAAPMQQQSQARSSNVSHNRKEAQPSRNKTNQSPLTLDLHAAQHFNSSATAPMASQASAIYGQGNQFKQSQALTSNTFLSPQVGSFTQSPTTLQGLFTPEAPMISPEQWGNAQQQRERRVSNTVGSLRKASDSMIAPRRASHVVLSNVPGNAHVHQFQLNPGHQQPSPNQAPSSTMSNRLSHPQSNIRRSLSNRTAQTSLPTLNLHSSIQPTPSLPSAESSTPFIRSYPPLPTHPNPTISALHQAHLRSPTLTYLDPNKKSSSIPKCFRFIKHVLMPPEELSNKNRHVSWDFGVSRELTEWFVRDNPSSQSAPPIRTIAPGSRLCRIRCINLMDNVGMPSQSAWAVADNVWPCGTAVVLNGVALDFRKKTHHGKDLPIDVTRNIRVGQNNLSTAVISFQENNASRYAIGVEFIQIADEQKIKSEMKTLPSMQARKRIIDQFAKDLDPEIEVIQSQRVLDLTDPFTSRIFEVPVRGINCHHNQCFDRDTFLQTRIAKVPGEPCGPDEFRVGFLLRLPF